ncbi:ABC transporter ATP-binding protein [Lysinibacillus odysseyi]|uniref:Molybdenum ABC transporter ATP-binding protein n=1 Tax=Lysinibacillus odysseyi 34hs-1 = NBRC 100172 TaxID=1220589 RepID=A0A0A3J857_9BACI|nr:ABC transporter ATP-binding protein [Lysinibacillus odysseyi]KGR83232.1 molybdenum ABC transporter ATP-binding protein [Lysinibacillus odysseyi 34hs-1 = NBRC 100172]
MTILLKELHLYRNGKTILQDVTWEVQAGEHWAVLGLNGSGKTTLLKVINGYLWPNEGSVQVFGETFGRTDIREVRKSIGWVSAAMIEEFDRRDPAIEIVLSGAYGAIRLFESVSEAEIAEGVQMMDRFGIVHLANCPFEYLSQGERQRVQIARAMMAKPKLLILDEPCTGLDLIEREHLLHIISEVAEAGNVTILYVTHHVEEILPCFTHTLLMRDGRVFAQGESAMLLNQRTLSSFFNHDVAVQLENGRAWVAVK